MRSTLQLRHAQVRICRSENNFHTVSLASPLQADAGEVRRMLEEASAQVAQQAEALDNAVSHLLLPSCCQMSPPLSPRVPPSPRRLRLVRCVACLRRHQHKWPNRPRPLTSLALMQTAGQQNWRRHRHSSVLHSPAWTPQSSTWMSQLSLLAHSRWRTQVG